jgi:DNA-binding MarR family transcriptional regulator
MSTSQRLEPAAPAPPSSGRDELADVLAALSRVLVAITARSLGALDVDLTLTQYRTVMVLASRGPQRTIDLARELAVHPSTVTRVCDRLIRRELLHRQHRPLDRRVAWLTLTEPGRELIGEVTRRRTAELRRLLDATDIDGAEQVVRLLGGLVAAAGDLPEREWWQRWTESGLTGE